MSRFYIMAGIFLFFFIVSRAILNGIYSFFKKIAEKTKTKAKWDDGIIRLTKKPLVFLSRGIFLLMSISAASLGPDIPEKISKIVLSLSGHLFKVLVIISICWIFTRVTSRIDHLILEFKTLFQVELNYMVAPFVSKILNVVVWALGIMMIVSEFGFDVNGFVAGLGLSGLAVALAGKSMLANLFGGLALLGDKTFDIGDWIVADGIDGRVERISLWSTKVRTFEKGLVTIPNEVLASGKILNNSKRSQRRVSFHLGVTYSTTKEKMQNVVQDIKEMLKHHEHIDNDILVVNFEEFGASSLDIRVYFFIDTLDWAKFMEIREDVNMCIMDILDAEGVEVAFPSLTVYKAKEEGMQ